jgi:arsenate reductase-like glutaredoxin family protein
MTGALVSKTNYRYFGETFATLLSRTLTVAQQLAGTDPRVGQMADLILEDQAILHKALTRDRSSRYTAQLADVDSLRDDLQDSLTLHVDAYKKQRTQPELVENAEKVGRAIEKVGRSKKRRYAEQSTQIEQLLLELSAPEQASAIAALSLDTLVRDIRNTQRHFHRLWTSRNQQQALREDLPRRTVIIGQASAHLNKLLSYVYSVAAIDSAVEQAAKALNQLIEETNARQRSRIRTGEVCDDPVEQHVQA